MSVKSLYICLGFFFIAPALNAQQMRGPIRRYPISRSPIRRSPHSQSHKVISRRASLTRPVKRRALSPVVHAEQTYWEQEIFSKNFNSAYPMTNLGRSYDINNAYIYSQNDYRLNPWNLSPYK